MGLPKYKPFPAVSALETAKEYRWKVLGEKYLFGNEDYAEKILAKARDRFHGRKNTYGKTFKSRQLLMYLPTILALRERNLSYRVIAQYLRDKYKAEIDVRILNSFTNRAKTSISLGRISPVVADALAQKVEIDETLLDISMIEGAQTRLPGSNVLYGHAATMERLYTAGISAAGIVDYLDKKHGIKMPTRVVSGFINNILLAKFYDIKDPDLAAALKKKPSIDKTIIEDLVKSGRGLSSTLFERSGAVELIDVAPEVVSLKKAGHSSTFAAGYLNTECGKSTTAAAVTQLHMMVSRKIDNKTLSFGRMAKLNNKTIKELSKKRSTDRHAHALVQFEPEIISLLNQRVAPEIIYYYLRDAHGINVSRPNVLDRIETLKKKKGWSKTGLPTLDGKKISASIHNKYAPCKEKTFNHLQKHTNAALTLLSRGFRGEGVNAYLRNFIGVATDIELTRNFLAAIPSDIKKDARQGKVKKPIDIKVIDILRLEQMVLQSALEESNLYEHKKALVKWARTEGLNPSQIKDRVDEISPSLAARNTIISFLEKVDRCDMLKKVLDLVVDSKGRAKRNMEKAFLGFPIKKLPMAKESISFLKTMDIVNVEDLANLPRAKQQRLKAAPTRIAREARIIMDMIDALTPTQAETRKIMAGLVTSLSITQKTKIALVKEGISEVEELMNFTEKQLLGHKSITNEEIKNLRGALKKVGLKLKK